MIIRTYGRRTTNTNTNNTSFNFDDSLSQDSPQESEPLNDIFNLPFITSSQESKNPYNSEPFDAFDDSEDSRKLSELTVLPPRSKKLKKGKEEVVVVSETVTLMETQECGEMMEEVDEVEFGLDGLRRGQPVRIRRASLVSLLTVCGSLPQRRRVRTHGMAKTIIDAVLDLNLDDNLSNLAAAALFFVLTSDGQEDYRLDSPRAIRFLIKLLKPVTTNATKNKVSTLGSKLVALSKDASIFYDAKGEESTSGAILQKVEEILVSCKELKPRVESSDSRMRRPELNTKWIALLTMEKACLSTVSLEETTGIVRKMGGNFKERLREHGGLDAVIDIMRECHSVMEGWLERYSSPTLESKNIVNLESPMLLLKCLKIMENATFLSTDNQNHLLGTEDDDFDYRHVSRSFTKLILDVIKILSGVSLLKNSSLKSDIGNGNNGIVHTSDLPLLAHDKVDTNEIIDISSSIENCSMDRVPSQKTSNSSEKNQILKTKSSTSGTSQHSMFDYEESQDPFGNEDPFAFDEEEDETNKWAVLLSGKNNVSQSKKVEKDGDQKSKFDLTMGSQQDSCNVECDDSPQASCSHVNDDETFNLFSDCLLAAVKVLMNLTNENPEGCQQIAACGGLETLCGLIVGHYPSFNSYLPNFSGQKDKSVLLEDDDNNNNRLNDQELDFLVAILGLLVNLVEKDGHNRSRLAAASISIPSLEYEITDVIPLLCSIFLANQGAGEAAEEGRQSAWNDEDPVLEGEKEAEKTIVEAYSALLLAFLSTESKSIRNAIAECLPKRKLSVLVPVLERFVEFHMSLNMISEETHSMVLEVIESCRMQ